MRQLTLLFITFFLTYSNADDTVRCQASCLFTTEYLMADILASTEVFDEILDKAQVPKTFQETSKNCSQRNGVFTTSYQLQPITITLYKTPTYLSPPPKESIDKPATLNGTKTQKLTVLHVVSATLATQENFCVE